MKRSVAWLFAFLLILSAVYAQGVINSDSSMGDANKASLNDPLTQEISIPSIIQAPAKAIFGINETITLQNLIVLLGVWIMVFIVILAVIQMVPLFQKGLMKWGVSVMITLLVSLSGSIMEISNFMLHLGDSFSFLAVWNPLKIIFAFFIMVLFVFLALWISKKVRADEKILEAEQNGRKLKKGIIVADEMAKSLEE